MNNWQYGWRFLNGAGGTNPIDKKREHYSVLPRPDEKWSDWTRHPAPASPDGKDCGSGRLHVMLRPDARYAPGGWHIWYARWLPENELGKSSQKAGVTQYQLRRIRPAVFWRIIRLGWCSGANLWGADLSYANLSRADLFYANLRGANLPYANLSYANLSRADLSYADLLYANLHGADSSYANLPYANLSHADLSHADLFYANLSRANLSYADLSYANLSGANLSYANLRGADLSHANLSYADLQGADLQGVIYDTTTVFPSDYQPKAETSNE